MSDALPSSTADGIVSVALNRPEWCNLMRTARRGADAGAGVAAQWERRPPAFLGESSLEVRV